MNLHGDRNAFTVGLMLLDARQNCKECVEK